MEAFRASIRPEVSNIHKSHTPSWSGYISSRRETIPWHKITIHIFIYITADRDQISPEFDHRSDALAWYEANKTASAAILFPAIKYRGYIIEKPKPNAYMMANNIKYLAYDRDDGLFDGSDTLPGLKRKIDAAQTKGGIKT